ncbi:sequestosome-1, partial [Trichonephila inaurata madagascariensis]
MEGDKRDESTLIADGISHRAGILIYPEIKMVHVIKVFLEESGTVTQIRRLALGSDIVSSYPLLKERIKDLLQLNTDLELKWKDSENDLILMSSDGELAQAIANAEDGLLKLYASEKKSDPKKDNKPNMEGEEHPLVICDGCEQNIFGARYKCLQCNNFDLCSSCNYNNKHPHHDMIKLAHHSFVPREWQFLGARRLWRSMFGRCPSSFFRNFAVLQAPTSSSSEDSQNESPDTGKMDNAFTQFLNGDFVNTQKLLSEGLGSFLKNWPGGVDIKLEGDTFAPNCRHYKQKKRCSNKDAGKEEKSASTSGKQKEKAAEQEEKLAKKEEKMAKKEEKMA